MVQFFLHFIVHIEEYVAYCHRTTGTAARIATRSPADRIARAIARRIQLVDNRVNVDTGAGTDRNHARQTDHEVVAAACRALAQIGFQERPCFCIKEGHAVQAATACYELTLFPDDVVIDSHDFTAGQAFTGNRYGGFFLRMSGKDTCTLTAIAEERNALTTVFSI